MTVIEIRGASAHDPEPRGHSACANRLGDVAGIVERAGWRRHRSRRRRRIAEKSSSMAGGSGWPPRPVPRAGLAWPGVRSGGLGASSRAMWGRRRSARPPGPRHQRHRLAPQQPDRSTLAVPRRPARPTHPRRPLPKPRAAIPHIRRSRSAALINLAADLPAPILADLLDLNISTAVQWTQHARPGLVPLPPSPYRHHDLERPGYHRPGRRRQTRHTRLNDQQRPVTASTGPMPAYSHPRPAGCHSAGDLRSRGI